MWLTIGSLAPLGMLLACGLMLLDLRQDAWDKVEQTSQNLLQVIERDIARNFELYDLSLQAVVENLRRPGVEQVDPDLRQLILFDRSTTARDMGVLLVLDENGDVRYDSGSIPPRQMNYADRSYFQDHKASPDLGLHIGRPLVSRMLGESMIPLSRRITKPDGSFGGAVIGTWQLSYFHRLFKGLDVGRHGAINLFMLDGTRLMREPYVEGGDRANVAGTSTFERFKRASKGGFVEMSTRNQIRRRHAFTRIGDLPVILSVAIAVEDVETEWRTKARLIGGIVAILCALTIGLAVFLMRELRRRASMEREVSRANRELSRLSLTDALTNLPNRRRFDAVLAQACGDAVRSGGSLSLLIVDADHFKSVNDRYGHQVGDEVLRRLAQCLSAVIHGPAELACRLGGEEFAILLPQADAEAAMQVADRIHARIANLSIPSSGIQAGAITVSIGLAETGRGAAHEAGAGDLYGRADAALYAAKADGRNRTRLADATAYEPPGRRAA